MVHNRDFIIATQQYGQLITKCYNSLEFNPDKVLEYCNEANLALSADTRLKGHRDYAINVGRQLEVLTDLAREKLFNYSPEQ